ncbi:hypothetical protein EDC01DRAFT_43359 [Geopyxis carbonaria]|nr:hypothetical protein EDC01DRAFT_43359 [Geopyxis carbonaria]
MYDSSPPSSPSLYRFPRRRLPLVIVSTALILGALLVFHVSSIPVSRIYDFKHHTTNSAGFSEETLTSPSHVLVRTLEASGYNLSHRLGRGFEGAAHLYTTPTGEQVVIKSFFTTTRTEPLPAAIAAHLTDKYNIANTSTARWPVDVAATVRVYPNASTTVIHALDAFYVDPSPPDLLPWRLVLPLYPAGALDHAAAAAGYLNLTAATLDVLYRPRVAAVFTALAHMHRAGFCHDDVKGDNIFFSTPTGPGTLADLGQTRPRDHPWHRPWRDCRLVDTERAWRSYLVLLSHGGSFEAQFTGDRQAEWAQAYWRWKTELTLPQDMAHDSFWGAQMAERRVVVAGREMEREQGLEVVDAVRRGMAAWKKQKKEGAERPWWLWEKPQVHIADEGIRKELLVTMAEGAQLIGITPAK